MTKNEQKITEEYEKHLEWLHKRVYETEDAFFKQQACLVILIVMNLLAFGVWLVL